MKWISARIPTTCRLCCGDIWKGATILLHGAGLYCGPCGRQVQRRVRHKEERQRVSARGAYAHGMATRERGE